MKKIFLSLVSLVCFATSLVASQPSSDDILEALCAKNPNAKKMTRSEKEAAKAYLEDIQPAFEAMNKIFEDFNNSHEEGYAVVKELLGAERLVVTVQPVPADVRAEELGYEEDAVSLDEEDYEEEA